ncbi:helix-turn-helix domain-containing protein [Pullulanibacillus camelliae]|uniref:helix-turn-helix domain-containing protein n=1 Tax=Pullulanibacillus camelliae TaxID=1707096 RepID=UPI001E510998|nr:helix-turn-helix transcriptional regulator [Pullulanibacillus camelliae]
MNIGMRIQNIRKSKNLKVTELAKMAYISQPYLSDIERGRTTPSLDKLQTICEALDISLGDFFGNASEFSPELIQLLENIKRLTEEERTHLAHFIEAIVNRQDT